MHELSLVQNLLQQLSELATTHAAKKIYKVTMDIGPNAGVVIDSFEFAFSALAPDNELTNQATLIINTPRVNYRCLDCGEIMQQCQHRPEQCQKCQQSNLYPQGGDELILSQVEME